MIVAYQSAHCYVDRHTCVAFILMNYGSCLSIHKDSSGFEKTTGSVLSYCLKKIIYGGFIAVSPITLQHTK